MSNNPTASGGTTPLQVIHMDTDTASDSEPHLQAPPVHTYIPVDTDSEDGGMQLVPADGELLQFAEDDSDIEFDARIMGVAMEEERDENDFTTHAINPHSGAPNRHNTPSQPGNRDNLGPRPRPRRLRTRANLTEEQHAALAVLSNWELLVTHALNSHRTIPQTRRRFQAKLLAPSNPTLEDELYASRFVVPASKSELLPPAAPGRNYEIATGADNTTAYLIPGSYREVVETDESSWWPQGKPRGKRKSDRGGRGPRDGSASGSGESSRVVSRGWESGCVAGARVGSGGGRIDSAV
ncbi:uncharacterized protein N7482_001780 [Penicillium canariense]|uniref:Uncharacterized protein n=1 Tax=Penicillium canariense TaxID=189055 RepID=A0A9W9IFS7_9EURO|nr:uncharacterized protein N7482_001780 [Penicillium canariense]KAJ5175903.1 hypothetical protein N7482_001780 [Penicillium canariense]